MTKRMITTGYSWGNKRFLATMVRALKWAESHPDGLIPFDWVTEYRGREIRTIFRSMIETAIDRRGKCAACRGRKDSYEQRTQWMRDRATIEHYRQTGHWSVWGEPLSREGRRALFILEHQKDRSTV